MKNKFDVYACNCQHLIDRSFEMKCFAFQVGSGEDEMDDYIFVKDGVILWWCYSTDKWYKGELSRCNYQDGIDISGGLTDINDYL